MFTVWNTTVYSFSYWYIFGLFLFFGNYMVSVSVLRLMSWSTCASVLQAVFLSFDTSDTLDQALLGCGGLSFAL